MEKVLFSKVLFLYTIDMLPPEEIPKLRTVCKAWCEMIDDASWTWEPQEAINNAKRWNFVLGHPEDTKAKTRNNGKKTSKVDSKYSLICQLGEYRRAAASTFVCVRKNDQALEIKNLSKQGTATLHQVLDTHTEKVTLVKKLEKNRFAVGYENGKVVIWDAKTLKELICFDAHKNPVSHVAYHCTNYKQFDRSGFIITKQREMLFTADESGNTTCWNLSEKGDVKERWSKTFNFPVKEIRCNIEDDIKFVSYNVKDKKFYIRTLSVNDGESQAKICETEKRYGVGSISLKSVRFFRNNNFMSLYIKNANDNQSVFLDTYLWNSDSGHYTLHRATDGFKLEKPSNNWWSYQTYALGDSVMWISNLMDSEGTAQIAYPKRLPNTRDCLPKDESDETSGSLLHLCIF